MNQLPLSVLLVSEDIPRPALGGLGKHVVALGNALMDAGHRVTLMGAARPAYAECADEIGFRGDFVAGCPEMGGWKEQATGCFNPWKRPVFARRLARAIVAAAPGYDVVHYNGHLPLVAHYLPAHLNFVQTRHDQGSECLALTRFRNGEVCRETDPRACAGCMSPRPGPLRTAISAAAVTRFRHETEEGFRKHQVIFVSDFLRRRWRAVAPGADAANEHVVHNFTDEAALAPCLTTAPPSSPRWLVAGRLDDEKGIGALLDRLAPLIEPPLIVDVWGHGPRAEHIRRRHGDHPCIALHGHGKQADVIAALAASSLAIVPSVCEESCSTVVLEALRAGRPCYALRRGGTPELARYGAPGQLKLFDSLDEMVDALMGLDPQQAMAPSGGETADVRARLPELIALYRQGLWRAQGAAA